MNSKQIILYIALLLIPTLSYAQKESSDVRRGNKAYNKENYVEAEVDYRKGLDKNKEAFEAHFNLGNALFKQEKYADAIEEYKAASHYTDGDKKRQAAIDHNIGNAHFAQQQYSEAIEAYKQALKNNPKDNDTRYNLVKAMQFLQQQEQQQQQNQDKNKDQNQQQQQQQQQQDQQDQEQQQQQQQEQSNIDKKTAEQLLQALEQDEQETQEKVKRQEAQGGKRLEKDW